MAGYFDKCRDCGNTDLAQQSGCVTCRVCGWSACG